MMRGWSVWRRTNIRYVVPEDIGESPELVSIDVSFISLTKVLGPVQSAAGGWGRSRLPDQAAV